jgi:carboxyl-terminal processing protease
MRNRSFVLLGAAAGVILALAVTDSQLVFTGADARPAPATKKYQLLELFVGAFERVRASYVEKPDDTKLMHSAINGMLSGLENSSFMDADALRQSVCTGSGCAPYGGAGVNITIADGLAQVVSPLDDSPAAKAGVMARDIIEEINDEPIQNMSSYEVYNKLKEERGEQIRLKIMRTGKDKPIDIAFTRDSVSTRAVRARADGGDVAYIRISQFQEDTADQLEKALTEVAGQIAPERLKGFVLDLRNNPGGLPDQGISVADAFLDAGEIVSIRGRKTSANRHFFAKPGDLADGKPVVVLINAGSASAAEIVAGALKDNHRATLVGTRSFGEASASTVVPIGPRTGPGPGALRLTTGHYFTPSGRVITGNGVLPDVEALQQNIPDQFRNDSKSKDKEHATFQSYVPPDPNADSALTVAYELLRGTKTVH